VRRKGKTGFLAIYSEKTKERSLIWRGQLRNASSLGIKTVEREVREEKKRERVSFAKGQLLSEIGTITGSGFLCRRLGKAKDRALMDPSVCQRKQ